MRYSIFKLIVFAPLTFFAQDFSLDGTVQDVNQKPISYTSVLLLKAADSTFVSGSVSNDEGIFEFEKINSGKYLIKISFVGYNDQYSDAFYLDQDKHLPALTLTESTEFLDQVTVTGRRPVIQHKVDRLVYNVENTVVSSGTTFDILRRTPGVIVNQGSILIRNRPAQVYINDRKVYLTNDELQQLLEGFAGVNVKFVEVITNPPAKYDAEGGAILNIVTSKSISIGYKGSVDASATVGIYPKYAAGTSQYYKNDWINAYAGYTFNSRLDTKTDEGFIEFFNPDGSTKSLWDDMFSRDTRTQSHSINTILDFTLSKKEELSFSANILHTPKANSDITGNTEMYNARQQLDSLYTTTSYLENSRDNYLFNLNYERQLGDNGASLTVHANYIDFTTDQSQAVSTRYLSPQGDLLNENSFNTIPTQESQIYTGQLDYAGNLGSWSFEAGAKYSGINSNSRQEFFNGDGDIDADSAILNDNFGYTEAIYASYFSFAKDWEHWSLKAGLRGEYTDANGNSRTLGIVNTQEYLELFPTFYLMNAPSENHSFGLNYSRRIDRPRFQSLNPYRYFLNENNFQEGNPNIQPAIANRIEFSYSYKSKLIFNLYYDRIDNAMAGLSFQDNENLTIRKFNTNLNYEQQYSLDVIYGEYVTNFMFLSLYTSVFKMENEFVAVESGGQDVKQSINGVYANLQSYFIIDQEGHLSATLSNEFTSNILSGSYQYDRPQYALNLDIQKSFYDGRLTLNLSAEDILNTNNIPLTSRYLNQNNSFFAMPESRKFRIGLRYKFGNFKLRDNSRSIDVEEETRLE